MPEPPLSDADGRFRLRPWERPESLDYVRCGDCGQEYPPAQMDPKRNFVYGGWVCTRCILADDAYK